MILNKGINLYLENIAMNLMDIEYREIEICLNFINFFGTFQELIQLKYFAVQVLI